MNIMRLSILGILVILLLAFGYAIGLYEKNSAIVVVSVSVVVLSFFMWKSWSSNI
jgi:hypothetical protein